YDLKAILLCTDGLTSLVEDRDIEKVLKNPLSTNEKVNTLIQMANENGGTDNISVALYECFEGSCSR
ncbi:serine/threonine-protein phosphatase, partial [Turicibacter sanguinis]|nr:serine/threonine-protein phosphatase [Turicibacter sanguinis]